MAMLKTIEAKTGGCVRVQKYLEENNRARALVISPNIGNPAKWAEIMDRHRKAAGKDNGRKWYHFIISPDPGDFPTVDEVLLLAKDWAEENYPTGEWAIAVHDDNEHSILHAHVILNAYDPIQDKKVQRSNAKVLDETRTLQILCQKHGMTPLDDLTKNKKRIRQPVVYTRAERELMARGITPYKEKIRIAIYEISPQSTCMADFKKRMAARGIEVRRTKRGVTYYDAQGHAVTGAKLGSDFTVSALEDRFIWKIPGASFEKDMPASMRPFAKIPTTYLPLRFDQIVARNARRKNIAQTKELSTLLGMISRNEIHGIKDFDTLIDNLEQQFHETEQMLGDAEINLYHLALATDNIASYRQTKGVYEDYKQAGLTRRSFAKTHEDQLAQFSEAKTWLAAHGLEDEAKHEEALSLFTQADNSIATLDAKVAHAKVKVANIKKLKTLFQNIMQPTHIVGHTPALKTPNVVLEGRKNLKTRTIVTKNSIERAQSKTETAQSANALKAFVQDQEKRRFHALDAEAVARIEAAREQARTHELEREAPRQAKEAETNKKKR